MAGKGATLAIRIVSDAKGAAAGFDAAEQRVGSFEQGLNRASGVAVGVLAVFGTVAKGAYDAASALQQSTGAVESVFGAHAAGVRENAEAAAQAVGLSTSAYNDMAAVMGSQLANFGYAGQEAVDVTDRLIGMGADMAATFGGSTADAVAAVSSLLRGETDPIERYGVAIKQADINARLAAMGLDGLTGEAAKAAQAEAVLGLLSEQTASSLGAFSREGDTAAGQTARAAAEFENAQAALGEALLPVVTWASEKFAELSNVMAENSGVVMIVAGVVAALAVAVLAINAAFTVYTAITRVATALQWLFNTALFASPIFWIAAVIAAIVAVVVLLYNKFAPVRQVISAVGDAFVTAFNWAMDAIQPVVDIVQWLADKIGDFFGMLGDAAAWVGDLFGSSGSMSVTHTAAGGGFYGAAAGAAGPMRGAPLGALSGGTSPSAGQGPGGNIYVTVQGALDPVAVGRQLERVLRDYGRATGRQVSMTMGRAG